MLRELKAILKVTLKQKWGLCAINWVFLSLFLFLKPFKRRWHCCVQNHCVFLSLFLFCLFVTLSSCVQNHSLGVSIDRRVALTGISTRTSFLKIKIDTNVFSILVVILLDYDKYWIFLGYNLLFVLNCRW